MSDYARDMDMNFIDLDSAITENQAGLSPF